MKFDSPKARSDYYATENKDPTMTDQSGAAETDINLIVKRYGVYGQAPGAANPPRFGDFADLPQDLGDAFRLMRSVPELQERLPEPLRGLSLAEFAQLTDEQIRDMIKPPEQTTAPTEVKTT